jgi:molybdate transport system substrate-binding protein
VRRFVVLLAAAALALAACSENVDIPQVSPTAKPATSASASPTKPGRLEIVVYAADSASDALTQVAKNYARHNTKVAITIVPGASKDLVTRLTHGAVADVYVADSDATMIPLMQSGDAALVQPLAVNGMAIVVPLKNPKKIKRPADLAKPGLSVARCRADTSCGALTDTLLTTNKVALTNATSLADPELVMARVATGKSDAGLVYMTSPVGTRLKVVAVPIPEATNAFVTYPMARLTRSPYPVEAWDFVLFASGLPGQAVLTQFGFTVLG